MTSTLDTPTRIIHAPRWPTHEDHARAEQQAAAAQTLTRPGHLSLADLERILTALRRL